MNIHEYTVDYFITKFSAIPGRTVVRGRIPKPGRSIPAMRIRALWLHANRTGKRRGQHLDRLFREHDLNVACVNDGDNTRQAGGFNHLPTPKSRILAALESFK